MTIGTGPLMVESGVCEITELCWEVMSTSDSSPSPSALDPARWPPFSSTPPVRGVVMLTSLSRYILVLESPLLLLVFSSLPSFLSGLLASTWTPGNWCEGKGRLIIDSSAWGQPADRRERGLQEIFHTWDLDLDFKFQDLSQTLTSINCQWLVFQGTACPPSSNPLCALL